MTEAKAIEIMKDWIKYEKGHKEKINKADELIEVQETIVKALEKKNKMINEMANNILKFRADTILPTDIEGIIQYFEKKVEERE